MEAILNINKTINIKVSSKPKINNSSKFDYSSLYINSVSIKMTLILIRNFIETSNVDIDPKLIGLIKSFKTIGFIE